MEQKGLTNRFSQFVFACLALGVSFAYVDSSYAENCVISWRTIRTGKNRLACSLKSPKAVLGTVDRRNRFKQIRKRQFTEKFAAGLSYNKLLGKCRRLNPERIDTRRMTLGSSCQLTRVNPPPPSPTVTSAPTNTLSPTSTPNSLPPTQNPAVTPTATNTPTRTSTPTPVRTPQSRLYLSDSQIDFGTLGLNETRHKSLLIRPLSGSSEFRDISLSTSTGITLLSPSEASARGAVPCAGALGRFCVVVLRIDAEVVGLAAATLSIRYSDVGNPAVSATRVVPIVGNIQSAATVSSTDISTISIRSAAAQRGMSISNYLLDEYNRLAAPPYADPANNGYHEAHLFSSPPVWANSWTNSVLDLSGVAWDQHQAGTAITRCHIVMATHFTRSGTIRFHRRDSTFFETSITQLANAGYDLTIGRLETCLPPDWTVYPLLNTEAAQPITTYELSGSPYISTHFKFSDQVRRISLLSINGFSSFIGILQPTYNPGSHMWVGGTEGDSGHPFFFLIDGQLVLVSQWWTTGGGSNFGNPTIQAAVRAAIQSLP